MLTGAVLTIVVLAAVVDYVRGSGRFAGLVGATVAALALIGWALGTKLALVSWPGLLVAGSLGAARLRDDRLALPPDPRDRS